MSAAYEMSEDDKREIVAEFLSESDQHIQTLNKLLLSAEDIIKANGEVANDQINTMFRSAHTIKGSASMLGFENLSHLTHEMETLLDRVRNKKMQLTLGIIEVLFAAFDSLNTLLDKLRNEGSDVMDVSDVINKIKSVLTGEGAPAAAAVAPPPPAPEPVPAPSAQEQKERAADISKFMPAFLEDSDGCVQRFNEIIMEIEKGNFNPDQLNELFRLAHTLKGSSGVIKCKGIESVAHKMEDQMSDLRTKSQKPSPEILTLLFKGIDWIKNALDALRKGVYQEQDLTAFLKDFQTKAVGAVPVAASATPSTTAADPFAANLSDEIKGKIRSALSASNQVYKATVSIQKKAIKGLKAAIIEERLKKMGTIIVAVPAFNAVPEDPQDVIVHILYATPNQENDVKNFLSVDEVDIVKISKEEFSDLNQPVAAPVAAAAPAPAAPAGAAPAASGAKGPVEITTMKVDARKLDGLMNLAGELVITRARFAQLVSEFNNEVFHMRESANRLGQLNADIENVKGLVRKNVTSMEGDKIQKILSTMESNLVAAQGSFSSKDVGAKVYGLDEATSLLGKLSSDIQSAVMQTRMVPIEGVFSRFKRLVRDISKELGKEINLELYGEDTELDKKIIDSLPDSLTHMIRNSVDHGIESKKDRLAAGKKEYGTIKLRAVHQGNSICIEIIDDGKGLDVNRIAKKAIEKGILTEEKASKLTDKEKLNLIFLPGFSTAEKVTGLSGRGVGMDVVKKMIESLSGTVDVETELGKGTKFVLRIPLTLAIIQALLVVINKQVYALPLESVSEIIKIGPKDVYSVDGVPMIKLRGHALSLLSMSNILGTDKTDVKVDADRKIVVITANGELAGIGVDRLIGEDEIVIKSFPDYFANVRGISGASILGDGNIALILDVMAIMRAV